MFGETHISGVELNQMLQHGSDVLDVFIEGVGITRVS